MSEDVDKVLSVPIMPEQTDTERKLKNNLIIFSVISLFMYYGDLKIKPDSRFMGLMFDGLNQSKIYAALFVFIVYAFIHYLWYMKDSFSCWCIRCTAISELRPSRWGSRLGEERLENKNNNTLYHWWNYTKQYIHDGYLINDALIKTIESLESKLQNEEIAADGVLLRDELKSTRELLGSSAADLSDLSDTLSTEAFTVALPRFNRAFSYFLISQNIRWAIFECMVPFGLGLYALFLLADEFILFFK